MSDLLKDPSVHDKICNDHVDTDKHYVNAGNQNTHIRNINNRSCSVSRVCWVRKQKYPLHGLGSSW